MHRFTHATVNGVRYGIDADGYVFAPDIDGTLDQLHLGKVHRDINPRVWISDPGEENGICHTHDSRSDAIQRLADRQKGLAFS